MTAPPSSIGSGSTASTSTRTMASAGGGGAAIMSKSLQDNESRRTPILSKKEQRPSFRASFAGTSSQTLTKKKGRMSSLSKLPKKLISSGRYPNTKIVKESIAMLDEEIQIMTSDAPFMDTVQADTSICLLDRKEVVVGELLGEGQFAQVYNVKDLKLRDDESLLSCDEQAKRRAFVDSFHACPRTHQHHCCSYAIKHLKRDLLVKSSSLNRRPNAEVAAGDAELPMDQQFQLAAADLVVEALYLSRIQHPHILRVRGMALGGTAAFTTGRYDSFFLILDKLRETLEVRIRHWRRTHGQPQETQLAQKTEYAYQMAQALEYLHRHRIIYRDLKPSNIGFKQQDDVLQIFDFGLCRDLPVRNTNDPNEVYFMTAAGTHRYMAVEVHKGEQYNQKADVYSFAMVYYELLAQEAPFLNFSEEDHQKLVCERQHRPKHFFGCVVPLSIQNLLGDAWAHEVANRLTMAQVVARLEDILVNTFQQEVQGVEGSVVKVESQDVSEKGVEKVCAHSASAVSAVS